MYERKLVEGSIYTGRIKHLIVDLSQIQYDLLEFKYFDGYKSDTVDLVIDSNKNYTLLINYIIEHFAAKFDRHLRPKNLWGNVLHQNTFTISKNDKNQSEYTAIICLDTALDNTQLHINYDDIGKHKNKNKFFDFRKDCFFLFPSDWNYFLKVKEKYQPSYFLTINFNYINDDSID